MPQKTVLQCSKCNKKLAIAVLTDAEIEIKCKCGTLNTFKAEPTKHFIHNQPYQNRMELAKK